MAANRDFEQRTTAAWLDLQDFGGIYCPAYPPQITPEFLDFILFGFEQICGIPKSLTSWLPINIGFLIETIHDMLSFVSLFVPMFRQVFPGRLGKSVEPTNQPSQLLLYLFICISLRGLLLVLQLRGEPGKPMLFALLPAGAQDRTWLPGVQGFGVLWMDATSVSHHSEALASVSIPLCIPTNHIFPMFFRYRISSIQRIGQDLLTMTGCFAGCHCMFCTLATVPAA